MVRTKNFDPDVALDAALDLFWYQGYDATSIPELLEAMNLSRSSLYRTFGEKHTLFLSALDRYQQRETQQAQEAISAEETVFDGIQRMLGQIVEQAIADEQMRGCFLTNTMTELPYDPLVNNMLTASRVASIAYYSNIIETGQADGSLNTDIRPEVLAEFLFSSMLGLRVMARNTRERTILENIARTVLLPFKANKHVS